MATDFPGVGQAELQARGAEWTAREIAQQPSVWPQVERLVSEQRAQLDRFLQPLPAQSALRVVLSGAGTSSFIGDCLVPALSARLQRRVESIATTDLVSGPRLRLQSEVPTLLVSFARSGNSPESVAAVDLAERAVPDMHHLIITCNAEGELAKRVSDLRSAYLLVLPEATNDRSFAMTSSFTSMLLTAALAFGVLRPERVASVAMAATKVLQQAAAAVQRLVGREFQRVVYLGSNELRGLASEAALKLLELTDGKVVALADSTLGFRHGPKTVINDKTLVVVMVANDPYTRAYDLDLLAELRRDARAGAILALSARQDGLPEGHNVVYDGLRENSDFELAFAHILVAQSYALLQSLELGLTPDRPNAAGVVNRVVQGVTIHPWSEHREHVSRR
ncbi:MAG TPA: SIS domain-containing protein [Steroidobacter sp.]|nr:SIS domain-containing protein [Steroidobacter sp.]